MREDYKSHDQSFGWVFGTFKLGRRLARHSQATSVFRSRPVMAIPVLYLFLLWQVDFNGHLEKTQIPQICYHTRYKILYLPNTHRGNPIQHLQHYSSSIKPPEPNSGKSYDSFVLTYVPDSGTSYMFHFKNLLLRLWQFLKVSPSFQIGQSWMWQFNAQGLYVARMLVNAGILATNDASLPPFNCQMGGSMANGWMQAKGPGMLAVVITQIWQIQYLVMTGITYKAHLMGT